MGMAMRMATAMATAMATGTVTARMETRSKRRGICLLWPQPQHWTCGPRRSRSRSCAKGEDVTEAGAEAEDRWSRRSWLVLSKAVVILQDMKRVTCTFTGQVVAGKK